MSNGQDSLDSVLTGNRSPTRLDRLVRLLRRLAARHRVSLVAIAGVVHAERQVPENSCHLYSGIGVGRARLNEEIIPCLLDIMSF